MEGESKKARGRRAEFQMSDLKTFREMSGAYLIEHHNL